METVEIVRTIIHPNYWTQGINHEAKAALLDAPLRSEKVECGISPVNIRSMRSLVKSSLPLKAPRGVLYAILAARGVSLWWQKNGASGRQYIDAFLKPQTALVALFALD